MALMLSSLLTLLDDVEDGAVLIVPRVAAEGVVALSGEIHIALGTVKIAVIGQMLGQEEQRGLIHHGATDIVEGRLSQPIAGLVVIGETIEDL